jgi:hypothetical protein
MHETLKACLYLVTVFHSMFCSHCSIHSESLNLPKKIAPHRLIVVYVTANYDCQVSYYKVKVNLSLCLTKHHPMKTHS